MKDQGYAVHVTDSVTGLPVAIFAYVDAANEWARAKYPGRHRIERIDWRTQDSPAALVRRMEAFVRRDFCPETPHCLCDTCKEARAILGEMDGPQRR